MPCQLIAEHRQMLALSKRQSTLGPAQPFRREACTVCDRQPRVMLVIGCKALGNEGIDQSCACRDLLQTDEGRSAWSVLRVLTVLFG